MLLHGKVERSSTLKLMMFLFPVTKPQQQTIFGFGRARLRKENLIFRNSIMASTKALLGINNERKLFPPFSILMTT